MADSERRELTVAIGRVGKTVEIIVADSGPGLPEQVCARLFEPFVTTWPDGMGMGLSNLAAKTETAVAPRSE